MLRFKFVQLFNYFVVFLKTTKTKYYLFRLVMNVGVEIVLVVMARQQSASQLAFCRIIKMICFDDDMYFCLLLDIVWMRVTKEKCWACGDVEG
jgi:hypothetical protein